MTNNAALRSNAILLSTAGIWGFAFVAQRLGMEHVGPYIFNAMRFLLGGLSLIPLMLWSRRRQGVGSAPELVQEDARTLLLGGGLAGLVLFLGASLQQIGVKYTTAGKAGFITGLYVIIVPILGLLWGQRAGIGTWLGAVSAVIGLYFLSVTENLTVAFGDSLVLGGAFFWATHVHVISRYSRRIDPILLAFLQFIICSAASFAAALLLETITVQSLLAASEPILYTGLMSVGMGYTMQVVGQRGAHPAHAAIILSLEAVFAVLGGWLVLGEILTLRGVFGCALMLAGMLMSQLYTSH